MQICKFHNGGFVLHKVIVNGQRYSAWFDCAGALLDAERMTPAGSTHVSTRETGVRALLAQIGKGVLPVVQDMSETPETRTLPLAE